MDVGRFQPRPHRGKLWLEATARHDGRAHALQKNEQVRKPMENNPNCSFDAAPSFEQNKEVCELADKCEASPVRQRRVDSKAGRKRSHLRSVSLEEERIPALNGDEQWQ